MNPRAHLNLVDYETYYRRFSEFDIAKSDVVDPYPLFMRLRRRGPVCTGTLWDLAGVEVEGGQLPDVPDYIRNSNLPIPPRPVFTVVGHRAVEVVLRSPDVYSSSAYARMTGPVIGHSLLEMDGEQHRRARALVQQAFTKRAVARWVELLIEPAVHALIDGFEHRRHVDLKPALTFPFPMLIIAGILGLPERDVKRFHAWAVELLTVVTNWYGGLRASRQLGHYLLELLAYKRRQPGDDLISALIAADVEGERLTDDEILTFIRLLLSAGAETTHRSLGNVLFGLLTNPEQLEAVRLDRSLLSSAIEEGFRWETSVTTIMRLATSDTELMDVRIPKNSLLLVCLGSANHDETVFSNPMRFDIHRSTGQHQAFASGPHACLGAQLARSEIQIAIGALLDRVPSIELDPAQPTPRIRGLIFRSPTALPVVLGT